MKTKKKKLSLCLSVLIIGFLVSSCLLNSYNPKAQISKSDIQIISSCSEKSSWIWNTTELISTESTNNSYRSSHAIDTEGNVYIVWYDFTDYDGSGTDADVFYKQWNKTTNSWTITEVVSTESTGNVSFPNLKLDTAGNIHIAWADETDDMLGSGTDADIFYRRWDASTFSWTPTEVVSTESNTTSGWHSCAVDLSGDLHVTWVDWTNYTNCGTDADIFYKKWDASSSTWSTTEVVSSESIEQSSWPSIEVDTLKNVHIVWEDNTDYLGSGTDDDIFYKLRNYSNSSWSIAEIVSTESSLPSYVPSLAVDYTRSVYVAWTDWTNYDGSGNDFDIFYKSKTSSTLWTTTEVISGMSNRDSMYPTLVADSKRNIHIVWGDKANYDGSGIDMDIIYKRWDSSNLLWTDAEVVSVESTDDAGGQRITVDSSDNLHVSWIDFADYLGSGLDKDIYYKRTIDTPSAPELAYIVPNPTDLDTIYLDWNDIFSTQNYYVYRSDYYIWSVEDHVPIDEVQTSFYTDTLPSEGYFYYVVVAGNIAGNSSHSNCQYVEYKLPHVREFSIITGLIIGAIVVSLTIMKTRKNKLK